MSIIKQTYFDQHGAVVQPEVCCGVPVGCNRPCFHRGAWAATPPAAAQPDQERAWVDLTDDELDKWTPEIHGVIREVLAQFKEKNT